MKVSIKLLQSSYSPGELVKCKFKVKINNKYTILNSEIYLVKIERINVVTDIFIGRDYKGINFYNLYDLEYNEQIVSEIGHYIDESKLMEFRLPCDSVNSSVSGLFHGFYNDVRYAIKAVIKYNKNGIEKNIEKLSFFKVYRSVYDSQSILLPIMNFKNKASILIKSSSISYLPGEIVNCEVSITNKTNLPIIRMKIIYHQLEKLKRGKSYTSKNIFTLYDFINKNKYTNINFKIPNSVPARVRTLGKVLCSKIEVQLLFLNGKKYRSVQTIYGD